jgi:energy-converting hydrogenase B subunit D
VTPLHVVALLLVAASGLGVVVTRDPVSQAITAGIHGLLLAVVFFIFQAPDVSLSAIVVSAVALPLMVMLAIAKVRGGAE